MAARQRGRDGLVGNDPALALTGGKPLPDRREISMRWLAGSFLTGATSLTLMGAALVVALDGKQFLATPPEVAPEEQVGLIGLDDDAAKAPRVLRNAPVAAAQTGNRRRMSVSTITRIGDADVIRTKPFEHVKLTLAADHRTDKNYPSFNPLNIFADADTETEAAAPADAFSSVIYGANVETEASIRMVPFSVDEVTADGRFALSDDEAEEIVRSTANVLVEGNIEVASLAYVDPARFGPSADEPLAGLVAAQTARIVPENVTVAQQDEPGSDKTKFFEQIVTFDDTANIRDMLEKTNYDGAGDMARAISTLLSADQLRGGHHVRLGLDSRDAAASVVRASVYDGSEHVLTIAVNDEDQFVPAPEPIDRGIMETIATAEPEDTGPPILPSKSRPSAYDAIWRAVLANDLPDDMARKLVRMVAADVDFQARIGGEDALSLFYSLPEEGDSEAEHELLYVMARFNGQERRFYRFTDSEGVSGFYDAQGRNSRQFLLRNPVPTGRFRSGFGMRRHPILKYSRMHWGVDWSAPRGTPIIAPGNGVVKKAGWASGYGKQTIIAHANGYETSYSHQTSFAKGVAPGARVTQGQVIGYVGTTGLSTGPHLHYEMRVNGKRVDPMRVRLPQGKTLEGDDLVAFERERDRIDSLLADDTPQQVAGISG